MVKVFNVASYSVCVNVSADEARLMLEPTKVFDKDLVFFAINDNASANSIGGSHW